MLQTKISGIANSIGVFDHFGTPIQNTSKSAAEDIATKVTTYYKHWNKPEDGKGVLSFHVPFLGITIGV